MTKAEMISHNERLAIQKIQIACINDGLLEAMKLCQQYMGLGAQEAFATVKVICKIGEGTPFE